jgi:hypothetical protein
LAGFNASSGKDRRWLQRSPTDKVELSGEVASNAEKEKARSIAEANAGGRQGKDHSFVLILWGSRRTALHFDFDSSRPWR